MVRIIEESTRYYVARDDKYVIYKMDADSKEEVDNNRLVKMSRKTYRDNWNEDLYTLTWDEYYKKFGEYPENFYAVKDGVARYKFNVKDKSTAEREARKNLDKDEYDEVLSYDEFYSKYDWDPEADFDDSDNYQEDEY